MGALYNSTKVSGFTRTRKDILDNYIETFQCLHLEMAHVTFPHSPLARICHRTAASCRKPKEYGKPMENVVSINLSPILPDSLPLIGLLVSNFLF